VERITTPAAATAIATDRAPHVIPATHQTSARSAAEARIAVAGRSWINMQPSSGLGGVDGSKLEQHNVMCAQAQRSTRRVS
jgi:hypothetical protein